MIVLKRGFKKAEGLLFPTVIFIIVNVVFFSSVFIFVYNSSTGETLYREAYVKETALFIDYAKPGTEILLDFSEMIENSKKEIGEKQEDFKVKCGDGVVEFGKSSFKYFSGNNVECEFKDGILKIEVKND